MAPNCRENHEARIEIIPLIDIMFFLLAAFMLVSLSMVNMKSVKVNLPTATTATAETKKDFINLSIDRSGAIFLDQQPVGANELAQRLTAMQRTNANLRVFISGDQDARHGDVIAVLDLVRGAGIEKVAFEIREPSRTMKRLGWINLLGVLALAALCAVQWQRDRRLNLEVNRLEQVRQAQEEKISEQQKASSGLAADLAGFKEQFKKAHADANETRTALRKVEQENAQLTREREQLKASVTNWAAAVTARDESLREANERLRDTTLRLNESILKFNDLATNYNASVQRFNDLTTNYNSVVTQLNELRSGKSGKQ